MKKSMSRKTARAITLIVILVGLMWTAASHTPVALAHVPHDPIVAIAVSPSFATDHTIFIGTAQLTVSLGTELLLKSTDGGLTWQVSPNFPNFQPNAVALSPAYASDGTVFVGTQGGGLFKSLDRGITWTTIGAGLGPNVIAVALSPSFGADQTLFAVGGSGVFKSVDGGTSWTLALAMPAATTIAISPAYATDHTVFVGTAGQGVFTSMDGGATWAPAGQLSNVTISALALSPAFSTDQTLVAGTLDGGVYVSTNGGRAWTASNNGMSNPSVTALVLSPTYGVDHTLFAATAKGLVWKSTNGALSWSKTGPIPRMLSGQTTVHTRALALSPGFASDRSVFLAMFEGFYVSNDGAATWRYSATLPPSLVRSLSVSPTFSTDHSLIASTYGGGVDLSTDGGQSWQVQNTGLANCFPDPSGLSAAVNGAHDEFIGAYNGPEKRAANSSTWTHELVLGVQIYARSLALSPDYSSDHTVFIGTDNVYESNPVTTTYQGHTISTKGLFVSTDGGTTWAPTGINGTAIQSIAISPNFAADGTMFAGSLYGGLFKSTDRGRTWTLASGVLGTAPIFPVAVSPDYAVDQTVFASVPAGDPAVRGLYRSIDGGSTWTLLPSSQAVTILKVAVSPSFDSDHTLFVGTLERGLMMSTDSGQTLVPTGLATPYVTALGISPGYATDRTVFAATYSGTYVSTDGANTWQRLPIQEWIEAGEPEIARTGSWTALAQAGASCKWLDGSSTAGNSFSLTFAGSHIAWIGSKGPDHGIAQVYLDGVYQESVDLYAPTLLQQQTLFQSATLAPATAHTLRVVVAGTHDSSSSGTLVTLDALVVSP